jgi:hypothetical protein
VVSWGKVFANDTTNSPHPGLFKNDLLLAYPEEQKDSRFILAHLKTASTGEERGQAPPFKLLDPHKGAQSATGLMLGYGLVNLVTRF